MKCKKCSCELKKEKYCPECGEKVPSHFNQLVEAENKQKDKQRLIKQKELDKQNKIIKEKGLKNHYVIISFILGLLGTTLVLWPAGLVIQIQWWYSLLIVICGLGGYFTARSARILNIQYYNRYRVYVFPSLSKAALGLSIFSVGAGVLMGTFTIALYL